jgi:methylenetetrahydrofolate reductase (NADPH)
LFKKYRLSRFLHHGVFTPQKRFYSVLERAMSRREQKSGLHRKHLIEHLSKTFLYGCMDCGDCGLDACAYSCPMAACPKCQRNGPCGGSMDGYCEVYPQKRFCIHYLAYHRLKKYGEIDKMSSFITRPNNWDYFQTSAWSNYTHQRDNVSTRIPIEIGLKG